MDEKRVGDQLAQDCYTQMRLTMFVRVMYKICVSTYRCLCRCVCGVVGCQLRCIFLYGWKEWCVFFVFSVVVWVSHVDVVELLLH